MYLVYVFLKHTYWYCYQDKKNNLASSAREMVFFGDHA